MSTFTGLNTMVKGVYSNQLALNTVGHNIVNADTPGYSRQAVNPVASKPEYRGSMYGNVAVGMGVETESITRSRDTYADVQYRNESSNQSYYEATATNFDKLESIFNDSNDSGIEASLKEFYKSWVDLSTDASASASRVSVIDKGKTFSDTIQTATKGLQEHIRDIYADISLYVDKVNSILDDIVGLNKNIIADEASGAMANDLRDQRDLLTDELSQYINITVHENSVGSYQISSGGTSLVSGADRLHLQMSDPVQSNFYGINYGLVDYTINIRESATLFQPQNGKIAASFDAIAKSKSYIDDMANMAAFMLTTLNDQHAQGYDLNGDRGINFYGITGYTYEYAYDDYDHFDYVKIKDENGNYLMDDDGNIQKLAGVDVIERLKVNEQFDETGGYKFLAAATAVEDFVDSDGNVAEIEWGNRTADGTNSVYISELFNMSYDNIVTAGRANAVVIKKYSDTFSTINSLGGRSINDYYKTSMTQLGVEAKAMDTKIASQELIMDQIQSWRDSTSGVDWNEELANMIKYQKGYSACSRCLNAMDECLEKLVNSTGVVGR